MDAGDDEGRLLYALALSEGIGIAKDEARLRNEAFFWYSVAARGTTAAAAERANQLRAMLAPTLFAEVKAQFRSQVETGISGGRFRLESTVVDDDKSWAIVRSGLGNAPRFDAVALVLVKEKVLLMAFTGFTREQKSDLSTLVRSVLEDVVSANRIGFFN